MLDNEDFSSLANVRSAMNDMEDVEEYDLNTVKFQAHCLRPTMS